MGYNVTYKNIPEPLLINDWESLEEGETIRVHCSHALCEDKNDAFTITRILGGCIYHCYRCGTSGAIFKGSNPSEALRRVKQLRNARHNRICNSVSCVSVSLPNDFIPLVTFDKRIPPHAYAWFYKYELQEEDLDTYYIGYSPKTERAIIPIYVDNKLIAWQGRDVYYKRNLELYNKKILKNKPLKYYTEYISNGKKLYYNIYNKNNNKIILVEDIISCIKVFNKYQYNVTAILNSTLHTNLISDHSLRNYQTVYVWLDPDAHIKAMQGVLRWQSMGINVKCIRTSTDPKDVPYMEMPSL